MRLLPPLLIFATAVFALPAHAQQAEQGARPDIEVAPLPRIKVVPQDPGESESDPSPSADDLPNADPGAPAGDGTADADGGIPRVITPGSPDADDDTRSADGRFHRVPEDRRTKDEDFVPISVPIRSPETAYRPGARLRQLDKMTGKIETYDIDVGEVRTTARLRVTLEACRAPIGDDTHGTIAFLRIWDMKNAEPDPVFSGWMFAESPALSALDHPRYDLWVINCTASAGDVSAGKE